MLNERNEIPDCNVHRIKAWITNYELPLLTCRYLETEVAAFRRLLVCF